MKKTWFVTGASKGLGLALVKKLLSEGYSVAATSRNSATLEKAVGRNENFLPLEVDLGNEAAVKQAVEKAYNHFSSLDIIVNNAGYGIGGAVEELSVSEIKASFDVNVFATIYTMQAAMPYFRKQKSGHIINISSIAGFAPANGWSIYAAAKFAVIGLSEVMAEDVKEFGVNVTVVAPGAFRTEFLSDASIVYAQQKIDDYTSVRETIKRYESYNGKQSGDPEKAADVFIALAEDEKPPVRLYLGSDAYNRATAKMEQLKSEMEANKTTSFKTDFD